MMGREKPTKGLLVEPMTVMASAMFGMKTPLRKQMLTRESEHQKFSFEFITRLYPKHNSSTVSLHGIKQRGEARMTPAKSKNCEIKMARLF